MLNAWSCFVTSSLLMKKKISLTLAFWSHYYKLVKISFKMNILNKYVRKSINCEESEVDLEFKRHFLFQNKSRQNETKWIPCNPEKCDHYISIDIKSKLTRNSIKHIIKLEKALLTFATLLFWRTGSFVLFASEYLVCIFIMEVMIQS